MKTRIPILKIVLIALILLTINNVILMAEEPARIYTNVTFKTSDTTLQKIYNEAERKSKWNIKTFDKYKVLIEGAIYNGVWLETQPMGGSMYAKRNMEVALNNILIFIDYQREDGRFPGMITNENNKLVAKYGWFQGYCFPMPAFELYYWLNKDKAYLQKLYTSVEKFDNYLWKTRDSDHDGCLETWCMWDTGEDACIRFNYFPNAWAFEFPPTKEKIMQMTQQELLDYCNESKFDPATEVVVPMESMDVMSYSYSGREVLALIAKELNNGKENYWLEKAAEVRKKLKSSLWNEKKNACYDKDKDNKTMDILLHNNLRCMYYGSFDQEMANEFISHHLVNKAEFWTPMPLPSIAVNDPYFRNISGNNWSGQPEGLTYQRSISALENYGHYAELSELGKIFLKVIGDSVKFTQQFDPFTATINTTSDGYGPSILTSLELISRFYGIHMSKDKLYWSCLDVNKDYEYIQQWAENTYRLKTKGTTVHCFINDKEVLSFSKGTRVTTDLSGNISEVIGIDSKVKNIQITAKEKSYQLKLMPNEVYEPTLNGVTLKSKQPFYAPF